MLKTEFVSHLENLQARKLKSLRAKNLTKLMQPDDKHFIEHYLMENYKRYLTESGHPIRYVSLAMQIESLSNALKDIVERLNGVDAYKIRDIRTIAECALIPYNQQDIDI